MPEEENNIKKIIIRKSLQRVRQKYIEAEKELNNLYDFLSDINVDLEVATDAENAGIIVSETIKILAKAEILFPQMA